jgi:hypothetical protein
VGTHLVCFDYGLILPVQVIVLPLNDGDDSAEVLGQWQQRRQSWVEELTKGTGAVRDDPLGYAPVVRIRDGVHGVFDLRTGLTGAAAENLSELLLAALPLPPEFGDQGLEPPCKHGD